MISLFLPVGSAVAQNGQMIRMDGSNTVYPLSEMLAEAFRESHPSPKPGIVIGVSGTGGGFKKFCRGEIDIANASRPILEDEIKACAAAGIEFIELPVAFDALTVAVSANNDFVGSLSLADLKKLWSPDSSIRFWRDMRPDWPDKPIHFYGAGMESGTFDFFTEVVMGKARSSRSDVTASDDYNMLLAGIAGDRMALGYVPYAYFLAHKKSLRAVPIGPDAAHAVMPSVAAASDASYPLSRPLFIYVNAKAAARHDVRNFIVFFLHQAPLSIEKLGYMPLPEALYAYARERMQSRQTGSIYEGGHAASRPLNEMIKPRRMGS
ncbi:MAG: PstS family phosphate ABC transporter substrate-binding protein [Alphaproteobacteria bacterium]|nr:MAG: PstS family phosphate ABC transporter substrate-binding protein [Alphaproteobacteria bacterium]